MPVIRHMVSIQNMTHNHVSIYRYKNSYWVRATVIFTLATVPAICGSILLIPNLRDDKNVIYIIIIMLFLSACNIYGFAKLIMSHRPIMLCNEGVGAVGAQFIDWADVRTIEQSRIIDPKIGKRNNVYRIRGRQNNLEFDDGVENVKGLLEELNAYVRLHGIDVFFLDRKHASRITVGKL